MPFWRRSKPRHLQHIQSVKARYGASRLLNRYVSLSAKARAGTPHKEYCDLQTTWNCEVLQHCIPYIPPRPQRLISLGAFLGLVETACATVFSEVLCVDLENHLWQPPPNCRHLDANLDSSEWALPDERFDCCLMVELLEHLMWSPLPLLKWIHEHCNLLVITTPDNDEWPAVPPNPWSRYERFDAIPTAPPTAAGNPHPMFHCKQYSQDEFAALLTFAGFRILELRRIGLDRAQLLAICSPRQRT